MSLSSKSSINSVEAAKAHWKTSSNQTKPWLHEHVESIAKLPLEQAVAAMADLLPGLQSYISYTGERCVKHASFHGTANLNHLAKLWMRQGSLCCDKDAAFSIRLQQYKLGAKFKKLYAESNLGVKQSKFVWFFTGFRDFRIGCGCCSQDPLYCIPYDERIDDALCVSIEQYGRYWPVSDVSVWHFRYTDQGQRMGVQPVKVGDLEKAIAMDGVKT